MQYFVYTVRKYKAKTPTYVTRKSKTINRIVLVSAGIELIFFLVAGVVLCSGFGMKIMLTESQNHRMVWVGRELKGHLVPTLLPWVGTPSN